MSSPTEFTKEQQAYLQGLVLGTDIARTVRSLPVLSGSGLNLQNVQASGASLSDNAQILSVLTKPSSPGATRPSHLPQCHFAAQQRFEALGKSLVAEEKAKRAKDGLGMWSEIEERARSGEFPNGTDVFLTKFHGMFFVAPAQNAFMCRLRMPGGAMTSHQLAGTADLADKYAGGYADVTTRANLQLREISASNPIHVLMGLRELGIVNLGAGADNIRNITASPLSGFDSHELIETLPLAKRLHYHILHRRELYGLPRKFNIALDGGGRISSLAETNDVSFHAVRVSDFQATEDCPEGVYFLLGLGGITGHGDFARSTGILVKPDECVKMAEAVVCVFIEHGDRTDRKKARLKYLLDEWGFVRFLTEVEKYFGQPLRRVLADGFTQPDNVDRWAHVGVHTQRQENKSYLGVVLPVGRVTSDQLRGIASVASRYGSGEIRLTLWQNLLIPNIHNDDVARATEELSNLGLSLDASSVRAGLVACTGNTGCKFAASNTKGQALLLANYLENRVALDRPVNIHLTGCHHSCAQHAIGDIGLVATKVEVGDEMVEGYHILVGGATGKIARMGTTVIESVPFTDVPAKIESLLLGYLEQRDEGEAFADFAERVGVEALKQFVAPIRLKKSPIRNGLELAAASLTS